MPATRLRLADADRLDDDHVEAGRLADQHGLARLSATPPSARPTGSADEGLLALESSSMRVLSPRMEPPVTTTTGRWPAPPAWALLDQPDAQRLDEGGLAHPRHAGDAHPHCVAGVRQQRGQHLLRPLGDRPGSIRSA
jgi:hypothetical protein